MELSHFFSRNSTKGFERIFSRPWNLRPMWGTEHALVDPWRWRFGTRAFKAAHSSQTLLEAEVWGSRWVTNIVRRHRMAPDWMLGVERGGFQIIFGKFHGSEDEEETDE
jgi:hypothetical protein